MHWACVFNAGSNFSFATKFSLLESVNHIFHSDIVAKPEDTSMVIAHHDLLAAEGEQTAVAIEMVEKDSLQGTCMY